MSKSSTVKTLRHFESDADLNIDEIESPPAPPLADLRRFQSNAPRLRPTYVFRAFHTNTHISFSQYIHTVYSISMTLTLK